MSRLNGLQRLSLLLVLAGLTTLYATSLLLGPEEVNVEDIGNSDIGEAVEVPGTVRDLSRSKDTTFFTLEGEKASIKAVYFGSGLEIEEDRRYVFEGRVEIYQGELELVVERVVRQGF